MCKNSLEPLWHFSYETTHDFNRIGLSTGIIWPKDLTTDKTAEEMQNNKDKTKNYLATGLCKAKKNKCY